MGVLGPRPCCAQDLPADVTVRALEPADWPAVRRIYADGIGLFAIEGVVLVGASES